MNYLPSPDFTIGADPEFSCIVPETGQFVESSKVAYHTASGDLFGADGCGITFEVRPFPSHNPLAVVGNIHNIFVSKTLDKPSFLDFNWIAGAYYNRYAMGGHIHFGIKKHRIGPKDACRYLDNYVSAISLLIEGEEQGRLRRGVGYGGISDFRVQDHGFEYRTPSSWITSPYIASAMLCLAKTVMYEVLHNSKFRANGISKLSWRVSKKTFTEMQVDKVREQFPQIWRTITSMKLYQMYKPYLDLLYFMVKNKLSWEPVSGMKNAWGISNLTIFNSHRLSLGAIWNNYLQLNKTTK